MNNTLNAIIMLINQYHFPKIRNVFFIAFLSTFSIGLSAQVTIWLEDFSGANQGWTQNFTDCDGQPASFAGVQNARFEVIDMEGSPCCVSGGGNNNDWTTNIIDISNYCDVRISGDLGSTGTLECVFGGPYFGCSNDVSIDNGHDQIMFEYNLDGGGWNMITYYCGPVGVASFLSAPLNGNTLQVRARPANKSIAELYWFDNIKLAGTQPTVNQPADVMVCSGQPVNVPFTGSPGATFSWTNDNTAIGLGASGNGNINFTAANVGAQEIATITVTPTSGGCSGPPVNFTITINPGPSVDDPPNQSVCAGDPVSVVFSGSGANPMYNWTNSNPAIGLSASGNGDINLNTAIVATPQTGTITVTPSENGCTGPAQTFTITVTPNPSVTQPANVIACGGLPVVVNLTGSPGATLNWTNNNPAIGLGASGSGNINFTSANVAAPEVALITVTPVQGSCTGTAIDFMITINPSPVVDDPPNQSVCAGDLVNVNFTGSPGATFNWTNNNPAIGLGASGSGDINFNAANVVTTQTGTITVTPSENGCTGTPQTFTVTVSPIPTVNPLPNQTVCGGIPVSANFSGSPGAIFNWTNDNPAIGLGASGSGNISFTSANPATQAVATITVTPSNAAGTCMGTPQMFMITVNPVPIVDDPVDQSVCAGDLVSVTFTGSGSNPTYNWTNSNPAIGLGASGTGNINFNAANVATTQTGTITVTPSENGCTGTPQTFTITVNPTPVASQPSPVIICSGPTNIILNGTPGATFNWTNDNPAIGLPPSGSGNPNFIAASVTTPEIANVTITPVLGNCIGSPVSFTITVNPDISMDPPADQTVCAGDPVTVNFTSSAGNPTFLWTNNNTAIGLGASGVGNLNFTAANVGVSQTATITVMAAANNCASPPQTFNITVVPIPQVTQPANATACGGQQLDIVFAGTPGATFDWTNDNPTIGLPASGSGTISFAAANVPTQQVANITVTPTTGPCAGTPRNFTITINPSPVMDDPADLIVCGGDLVDVIFTGSGLPIYTWTNTNQAIGLPAFGSGDISYLSPFVATQQTGTITVIPTENGCVGAAQNFTITVSPAPTVNLPGNVSICSGQSILINLSGTPGATFNWTNDNPAIGLPVSGSGNIDLTAANVATTQTGNVTITPTIGSCDGVSVSFSVTINPVPTVVDPADQTVCAGEPISVNFTGTGNPNFTWTNNNPAIGLAASGTGNISFSSANVGTAQTATITVIPTLGNCSGTSQTFNLTVNPTPTVDQPANVSVCNGELIAVDFTGTAGAVFSWTNDNPAIGLPASGSGNLNFTSAQVSSTETATITVTPAAGPCPGTPVTFTISVSPGVSVNNPGDQAVCVGDSIHVLFSGTGNPTFSWTNDNPLIGLPASGTGDIHIEAANVAAPETATITVTPEGGLSGFAYITNSAPDNFVLVIDLSTNTVVDTIPVGSNPLGVSVSPDNSKVYITNRSSNTVSVIDVANNTVIATIPVGMDPRGVVVSPDGSLIYTANFGSDDISVIDAATNTVIATIPVGNAPHGVAISPDGNWVYVTNGNNEVAVVDATTNTLLTTIPVGAIPKGIQVHPNGLWIYVANSGSNTVSVIEISTNTVIATVPVGTSPNGIAISPDGSRVYVTNDVSDDVSVIDPSTNTVIATIPVGTSNPASPVGVSVSQDGSLVYVSNILEETVSVIDAATNSQIATIPVGSVPYSFGNFIATTSTCTGAPQTFTITVSPTPTLAQPNNFTFCGNTTSMVGFNASPGATVNWTNDNPAIGLPASGTGNINFIAANVLSPQTATITATPVVGSCSGTAQTFTITINPAVMGGITGDQLICEGDSTTLTASGGMMYEWDNGDTTAAITVSPSMSTTYVVIITNSFGCFRAASALVDVDQAPVASISGNTNLCAGQGTTLTASGGGSYAWSPSGSSASVNVSPTSTTTYTVTVTNAFSCTATAEETVVVNQPDTLNIAMTSCNPADTGTVVQVWQNQFGCDSTVTTVTALAPTDTVNLTVFTCDQNQAGTFTQNLMNQFGCDSTVTTTVVYDPTAIDSTFINLTSCDTSQVGVVEMMFTGSDGCDSLVITTTALLQSDTVNLTAGTCDPSQVGVTQILLQNQAGCDSLVITTTALLQSDTVNLTAGTCDPSQVGVTQILLQNQAGCDSLVITTTALLQSDTVNLTAGTCDPSQVGVTQILLQNQAGCDSLVITTTALLQSDTVNLTATTCDSSQVGVTQVLLQNQAGCDSLVITTVSFDPNLIDSTFLNDFTCDPNMVGTTQTVLTGADGCDSIVVLTLALSPSDTLMVSSFTCDPNQAGTFVQVLQNQAGCDSVLISEVIFDAAACAPTANITGVNPPCADASDGAFSIQILSGQPPLQYDWENNLGNSGTGQITDPNSPTLVPSLPTGTYTVTITDLNNQATSTATVTLTAPPMLQLATDAVLAFNGYAISCNDSADGAINSTTSGGTSPYLFAWNTGATTDNLDSLAAGTYTVTVTDDNGCTAIDSVDLLPPPALDFALALDLLDCGDSLVDASISAMGGVSPYTIMLDGNILAGSMPSISPGAHTVTLIDANGCSADSTVMVNLPAGPMISLPADTTVVLGSFLQIEATTNLSTWVSLSWQPLPDSTCANCLIQTWAPKDFQQITVTIVDSLGCSAQATIRVSVNKEIALYVPNVFSPNNDGFNDFWQVNAGDSVVEIQEVQVFDRWGNLQYAWENSIAPNAWPGWDGTTHGKKAQVGVYVYYLKVKLADGTEEVVKGDVTILE